MNTKLGKIYAEKGFFCPVDAIPKAKAKELRQDYEAAENELHGDIEPVSYTHLRAHETREALV